jgi:hypothetical protein
MRNGEQLSSWYEFDEHNHMLTTKDGQPLVKVRFSQIEKQRDAVNCWVAVKYVFGADEDVEPLMEWQKVNLAANGGVNGWKRIVDVIRTMEDSREWEPLIQQMVSNSLGQWFEASSSFETLGEIDLSEMDAPFLVEPFISGTGLTMIFSPPGSGKSMLAMGLCVSLITGFPVFGATPIKTGNVLYVDFEDHVSTHSIRRQAMLNAIEFDGEPEFEIVHYKVNGDLKQHISRIRTKAREMDCVLIVVDSMGRARGNDPSDGNATIKLTDAMDTFGFPVLALDHTTKAVNEQIEKGTMSDPSAVTGIGSIFSTASARLGWFLHKLNTSKPMARKYNLYNNKHNIVAQQATRSLTIDLKNNKVGHLTSVKFKVWSGDTLEELRVESAQVTIARWMVRESKTSTTTTEASNATGLSTTSAGRALGTSYFEKMTKTGREQPYRITTEGVESAGGKVEGREHEETQ